MCASDDAFDAKVDAKSAKYDANEAIVTANLSMQLAEKQAAELRTVKSLVESTMASMDTDGTVAG